MPGADGRRTLVLVVEDNPMNLELVEAILEREGFQVVSAGSGEEALECLQRLRPDLVLVDIQLPGMDGLALTRLLKGDARTAELPIVALSAHARLEDREAAMQAGCTEYISKPVDTRALPRQLAAVLERSTPPAN